MSEQNNYIIMFQNLINVNFTFRTEAIIIEKYCVGTAILLV